MSLQAEISDLDKALRDAGVSVDAVLQQADINRSTWTRWKSGTVTGARYDDVMRVRAIVATALANPEAFAATQAGAAA